jgi:hypothetical protein
LVESAEMLRKEAEESFSIESSRKNSLVVPSEQWAWMLGYLCGGASVGNQTVAANSLNWDQVDVFKRRGEALFGVKGHESYYRVETDRPVAKKVSFYGKWVGELGDLRRETWASTVVDKYGWVLSSQEYVWSFLGSYLDTNARVKAPLGERFGVMFHTHSGDGIELLGELLSRVGVSGAAPIRGVRSGEQKWRGVMVDQLWDVYQLSDSLRSTVPIKQLYLVGYWLLGREEIGPEEIRGVLERCESFPWLAELVETSGSWWSGFDEPMRERTEHRSAIVRKGRRAVQSRLLSQGYREAAGLGRSVEVAPLVAKLVGRLAMTDLGLSGGGVNRVAGTLYRTMCMARELKGRLEAGGKTGDQVSERTELFLEELERVETVEELSNWDERVEEWFARQIRNKNREYEERAGA